jgi:signal transduction histidine kinase
MSSAPKNKFFHSFAFYLILGYLVVYAVCTVSIYLLFRNGIAKSARSFDRQDVNAECEELVALLNQNNTGSMLAEAVTMERYPPSTIFIVRVINQHGRVEYTLTWPKKIDVPEWGSDTWLDRGKRPVAGESEYYLKHYNRYIQVQTTIAKDGRILQVGKGSFLEMDQKSMLLRMLLVFGIISTVFSVISGFIMMMITLGPIHHITESMSHIIQTGAFERGAPPVKSTISELDTLGQLFTVMTSKYANLIQAMRQTMDHVAHDFRTPLTRIRGSAELALSRPDPLPQEVSDTLAGIIEDCDSAKLQLQNLMDAREMESGFVKLNLQPLDLTHLMAEMMDMYSLIADEKAIHFVSEFPQVPVTIKADRGRLARAVGNLVDNAIKYTPHGGTVTLRLAQKDDKVEISVSDTGIGIPEEEQGLVWQRLFRGKKAQEAEKGLGLGLNIVQIIIEAHGGHVSLESKVGQGTTFRILLPAS